MAARELDAVIIGGGPAGSTAATLLKQYEPHRRIAIIERAKFPRHHIGESTLPEMNRILHKMGVLPKIEAAGFIRKRGITYKWADDKPPFRDVFSEGVLDALAGTPDHIPDYSWQVDRSRYDEILLSHARECGVEVLEAEVVGVRREGERIVGAHVVASGEKSEVSAEFVVDCSGQSRALSSWLKLEKQGHALGDLAIFRYYRGFRWNEDFIGTIPASRIFFQAAPRGWMWFIPLSADLVSVGLVTLNEFVRSTTPDRLFDEELAGLEEMRDMLSGAVRAPAPGDPRIEPRTHVISDWSYSHTAPAGPGYYLAGDAAAFVDPILSSGVLLAHQSGLSVANAIYTEWSCPDIRGSELHAAYAEFYRDLYGGFLRMAQWWYTRREVGIDEWLKLARELGASAIGAQELAKNDSAAFMTFAAGFLTDFRFVNVGCGFGDKGLAITVEGIEGTQVGDALRLEILDRSTCFRRRFERLSVDAYLATDIGTNRWWRLPVIVFHGEGGQKESYRPPILPAQPTDASIATGVRAIERVLRSCDGKTPVSSAVDRALVGLPAETARDCRKLCDLVLAALSVKGLLEKV